MKSILLMFVVAFLAVDARPQTKQERSIKGYIIDSNSRDLLQDATVVLLRAADSLIVSSVFTDDKGAFILTGVVEGDYKLYIGYIGYQSILRVLHVTNDTKILNIDTIVIRRIGLTLGVIDVLETRPSIVVKKDTLEFNADHFKTREHAVVEELLKKLPGVQVGRDGSIKVNGETVKKLLVDGRSFFGDDPKIATRNLTADMIDKIQFIDRKSDWSQFTGISDGQNEKTINITIKNDKKKGYFGRLGGGLGTDEHFAIGGNVNGFREDQQFAFLTNLCNINGYQDDGEQIRMAVGGNGNVRNWNGGSNYSKDFSRNLRVGASYSLNDSYVENQTSGERQNLLPDTTWYYKQDNRSVSGNINHSLNAWMEFKPDSVQMLNISTNISYVNEDNIQDNLYTSLGGKQQLLNSGNTHISSSTSTPSFSAIALYGRKFKRAGRTLSASISVGYNSNNGQFFNTSYNSFVQSGGSVFIDTIDQKNDIRSLNRSVSWSLIYTEPIFNDRYLELTYTYTDNYSSSDKRTYNYNIVKEKYDQLDDSLSNTFEASSSLQQAGIKIRTQKPSYSYTFGLNTQFSNLDNNNVGQYGQLRRRTINFFPSAIFNYGITRKKSLRISYAGGTQQPSITQLQPVPNNNNPLYIQLGNPDLKPTFSNLIEARYTTFNPVAMHGFSVGTNVRFIANKIINASWFDSLGRQISQPLNINGTYNLNVNISNSFPLRKLQTSINTSTSLGFNRDPGFINGVKGNTNNFLLGQNVSFNYSYKELLSFSTSASFSYNIVRYSVLKSNNVPYLSYTFLFDYNVYLPGGVALGGNLDCLLSTGRTAGYNQNTVMLNAYLSKKIINQRGVIRLQGFDLLNRNQGITRNVGMNYIEDVRTSVPQHIFLITLSYLLKNTDGGN